MMETASVVSLSASSGWSEVQCRRGLLPLSLGERESMTSEGQRGVDLAAAPLRVRGVDVAVALLREMRDAATSGIAETSESDVPLACAATPSRSRRNDVDEENGCRDSASETTPQRLW